MKDYNQEKLVNLIIYFVKNTKHCGITKLCKLLYFADFRHFRETGTSITGMTYMAWRHGPVPASFHKEIKYHPEKFKNFFSVVQAEKTIKITPLKDFDDQYFTDREIRILEEMVFFFKNCKSNDMVDSSHQLDYPWKKTVEKKREGESIDYELAFDKSSKTIHPEKYAELKENRLLMSKFYQSHESR